MKNLKQFINEVFEFNRNDMDLDPKTRLIHYHKGIESYGAGTQTKQIPYKEMVMHTPLEGVPRDKNNLWVHVIRYPSGYGEIKGPHLQVHFDVSHVNHFNYLDAKRDLEIKQETNDPDPGEIYARAYALSSGKNIENVAGGNAFSGISRTPGSGMTFLLNKIAPHIVKSAWHISKAYPKLPIAFNAGSDVPGHAQRKFLLYHKITNALEDAKLIHKDDEYIKNKWNYPGILPIFKIIHPIHER